MKLAGLLLFALSTSAFAGELPPMPFANSQHLHQAESHTFEVTPAIGGETKSIHSGSSSTNGSGYHASLLGEYAFTDMFALAARVGYDRFTQQNSGCTSNCVNPKSEGGENPDLIGKFKIAAGPGTFKAILDMNFSLATHTVDGSGNTNKYTGGDTANLKAAYEFDLGETTVGLDAGYDIWKQNRKQSYSAGSATQNGNAVWNVDLYYETKMNSLTLGALAGYKHAAGGGITLDDQSQSVNLAQGDAGEFAIYTPFVVGGNITLYPQLTYYHTNQNSSEDNFDLNFAARFVF